MYTVIICFLYNSVNGQMVLLLLKMIWFVLIKTATYAYVDSELILSLIVNAAMHVGSI